YDDRLSDLSASGINAILADTERLLDSLHALPRETLSEPQVLDRRLAEGFLIIQRWELQSSYVVNNPTLWTGEAIFGVIGVLLSSGHFLTAGSENLERLALEWLAGDVDEPVTSATSAPELARFQSTWQAARKTAESVVPFPDWPVRYVEQPAWLRRAAPYLYFLPYRSPPPLDMPAVVDYYVPPSAVDDATMK